VLNRKAMFSDERCQPFGPELTAEGAINGQLSANDF
jgi:hypothetical protein